MKSLSIAAAALLFGTSAFASPPSTEPAAGPGVDKSAMVVGYATARAVATSHAAYWRTASAEQAWTSGEASAEKAPAETWHKGDVLAAADPDLDLAVEPDSVDDDMTGMGGPEDADLAEAPVTIAQADLTTRPAAENYPACRPGPGDDNCIQLYEPGVSAELAAWTAPTGGLMNDQSATATGGPYEPVDSALLDNEVAEKTGDEADLVAM